ncbi:MAG TPA: arginine repressor [Hungateiclostridium thermocellum]|jgi:transcriptional regulator of arginine metabolism|uniref:Arginine repressor n=2 Tax=Acetivibrio thermocellus TaxID=1515 RepID=ARGR_ACET2|nr:arginine repressor [Acetivibrio thermocellus]A3DDM1.1 RecName: Full=Arginine repressor [Acetivibrio thermocellus ATCC 27405]CDG35509.1 Arginine repressor [Acetivibrio thermocellus BC1]ABN52050.1 arginine repressor, ArgR [Acetivibrio thermocellus ATCC 27405]ADU74468.1 arginine repressor, ArgR [Acetivibrio thermocellus DSM 1313]ALX08411.1 arginine repressor, ArgR [Acetivibrio thermocellus AD2]ANV76160.1 arginine repressor, ArgR [Acetivibrio thermocellus DSM 2360]
MKHARQAKILEIIDKEVIETQEEIADRLKKAGMEVTQATISRDIKELRLIKVMTEDGRYKYAPFNSTDNTVFNRLMTVFSKSYVSSDYANNIVVVKTLPGMAPAAASAIDSMNYPEIVGSIAGDDTVLIVCRSEKIAKEFVEKLSKLAKSDDK